MGIYLQKATTTAFRITALTLEPNGVTATLDDGSSLDISFGNMATYAPVVGDYFFPASASKFWKSADFQGAYSLVTASSMSPVPTGVPVINGGAPALPANPRLA